MCSRYKLATEPSPILGEGSVVTWGHAAPGADSSGVEHQLQDVKQIQATCHAFAALLGNGSVVTWGDADCGGDGTAVQGMLTDVRFISVTGRAFAAILGDGSIVTGGDAHLSTCGSTSTHT